MGLNWHLADRLADRDMAWDDLAALLSFPLPASWRTGELPADLSLEGLAELCDALGVQPGELLTYASEGAAERAERDLARNLSYQSFLAFQERREAED